MNYQKNNLICLSKKKLKLQSLNICNREYNHNNLNLKYISWQCVLVAEILKMAIQKNCKRIQEQKKMLI